MTDLPRKEAVAEMMSEGMTLREISRILDIPYGAVKSIWAGIRKGLGEQAR